MLMKDLYGMGGYKPVDAFYGNFNGNGHYLSGFWFENSDSEFVGFVGQNFGTIKNLKLGVAITVSSSSNVYAGAFCGENRGTIENCSAFGVRNSPSFSFYATAESFAGGITGVNYGTVKNCGKGLDMSGTSNMGGIVGLNYGNIDGCTNNQEKKEITKQFDFHSLRKTHASMLNELGIDQKYIQTRLGHSDIDITVKVYESVTDLMRIRGRNALNNMFSNN